MIYVLEYRVITHALRSRGRDRAAALPLAWSPLLAYPGQCRGGGREIEQNGRDNRDKRQPDDATSDSMTSTISRLHFTTFRRS